MENKNGYKYTKQWYQFVFETKEMVRPIHAALYFWIVELNNQLHWKEVFGLPTQYSMQAINVKGRRHYQKALEDLIKWGFVKLVSKATNQHNSNQISLNLLSTLSNKQGYKQADLPGTKGTHSKTTKTIKKDFEPIVEKIDIKPIPDDAR